MSGKLKFLLFFYFAALFSLFLYSFTQVDLSLTLSKVSVFQAIEKNFQYIGFFQRPVSATIFSIIVLTLFVSYLSFLYFAKKGVLKLTQVKIITLLTFGFLVFSYNAFSYDLFNYIFDAKIVTFYQQNPFLAKPSDFLGDPMLNFMRWTHRFYPYGISWLVLTVPLSFLGANIFLLTFFLFKLSAGLSYLGSGYLIYKISEKIFPENKISNTAVFVLNPLVLIEGLISAHNDIQMVFITLLAFYLYLNKKKTVAIFTYIFSIGIKYATAVLVPPIVYLWLLEKLKKKINWEKFFIIGMLFSLLAIAYASIRTTFQPWYLLFPLSLASFVSGNRYILTSTITASLFAVLIYIPYVYMTDYAPGYPQIILKIELTGLFFSLLPLLYFFIFKKHKFD